MEKTTRVPIIIAGAGLAGLSLCYQLLLQGEERQILLIDQRTGHREDRTWCFWDAEPTPFTKLATHSWTTWEVRTENQQIHRSTSRYPYRQIPSAAFYKYVLAQISDYANVSYHSRESVLALTEIENSVIVQTNKGTYRAEIVIDARGVKAHEELAQQARRESVWIPQHFVGLKVETARPVFDPGTCTLMDFQVDQSDGLHFVYALHHSPTEALIENVYMTNNRVSRARHQQEIAEYLRVNYGIALHEWHTVGHEAGFIPMTNFSFPRQIGQRIFPIGIRGGQTRAASGYTFVRVQRYAERLARQIVARGLISPPETAPSRFHLLDTVFLSYLARYPTQGPELFERLFAKNSAETIARFMMDRSSPLEELSIVRSLPILPFARLALDLLTDGIRPEGRPATDPGGRSESSIARKRSPHVF